MEEKVRKMTNPPEPKRKGRKAGESAESGRDGEEGPEVPVGAGAANGRGVGAGVLGSDTGSAVPLKPR